MSGGKCRLVNSKVVAIISTQIESNLITINPQQYADPRYQVAILMEVEEYGKHYWDRGAYHILLLFHDMLWSLAERNELNSKQNQTFKFELVDDIAPQIENIVNLAVDNAL